MGIAEWIGSIVAITGLWFTAFSVRAETKTRRIGNLLSITASHREIWKEFLNNPSLARVRSLADLTTQPVTDAEQVFVTSVILHVNSVYYAMNDRLVIKYEGLRRDIAQFFALPIPKSVWEKNKQYQNADFVDFMESILK